MRTSRPCDPLAHPDAHRRRASAAAASAQLVQQCCRDPRARTAKRVPDRDRAAVDVHDVVIQLQLIHDSHGLGSERLVDLYQR
jgi:hypothetical protein